MIQESESLRMSDKKWQEDFSQILELIRTSHKQLEWVKQQGASVRQIANCVCTARKYLQKAEQQLNELHRTAETDDTAEKRLQSMELWEKDRQRAREIGDAAKELWRMDAQRTAKVLRTVSAELMKARQELRFLRVCVSVKRSRVASSQQIVDAGDTTMQQCNEDFRLALTELETVRKQLRKEKSWLKRLQRRVEVADDPHE